MGRGGRVHVADAHPVKVTQGREQVSWEPVVKEHGNHLPRQHASVAVLAWSGDGQALAVTVVTYADKEESVSGDGPSIDVLLWLSLRLRQS